MVSHLDQEHLDLEHPEPERLVLLALGEESPDVADAATLGHLRSCAVCRAEVDDLRTVVTVGRETGQVRHLPPPPAHVWDKIASSVATAASAPASGTVIPLRRRRVARWIMPLAAAAAAAVVAIVGTVAVQSSRDPEPDPALVVRAQTDLGPLPDAPSCDRSYVRLLEGDRLHVHVSCPTPGDEAYEVWLLDLATAPTGLKMVALGTMGGRSDQIFPLDPGVDLGRYNVVDVSAEPRDGNPLHSGKSVLRGTLK